jgi:methylase of polypeptide subunit release factors
VQLHYQDGLDSSRTAEYRNKLGQHATPSELSRDIMRCSIPLLPHGQPIRFMDPAFGTGAFYSALEMTIPNRRIADGTGFEIEHCFEEIASKLWSNGRLKMHVKDFTLAEPPNDASLKPNLIVCNPPYVRHHHIGREKKANLQK